ncbi:hypothetical protein [Pseudoalteromonas sp. GABNS16H]|uniref:hypothetical protein n=1 Tax=Pseudoalteromonas sp. GABNS16H TaxID=3025325 RepID=UPI0023608EE7|nr:hypothetical protein [Pseudoalteromonas sp. GABNS16H]MDC9611627.1 hypothetical protein [Pseudoalteromonas sp. GABNS16H]
MRKISSQTGAIIYGVGLMAIATVFVAYLVQQMQSNSDSSQFIYWLLAALAIIPFAWGWAGISGIYHERNGREAWWSIGRFTGRK